MKTHVIYVYKISADSKIVVQICGSEIGVHWPFNRVSITLIVKSHTCITIHSGKYNFILKKKNRKKFEVATRKQ